MIHKKNGENMGEICVVVYVVAWDFPVILVSTLRGSGVSPVSHS